MTLESGARLGPYEILGPIGAGGMGEVYEARDTRLGRTVAIKILREQGADSPDRRARFEREAKVISQLNHPHICSLFDVGEEGGVDFLVMEHIQGETLADRLKKGPLPLEQVIAYGSQIADGLATAHQSGIVHRDLKPGNIMLTKSGVKILDFGLAKLLEPEPEPKTAESQAPTRPRDLTKEQGVIGTLHYMSPEQLQGKTLDARSDIFALGVVLYEMATAKRAFDGDSSAGVIAAILEHAPPRLRGLAPPLLADVVMTCLRKDPDERVQSAADVRAALTWVREPDETPPQVSRRTRNAWPLVAGALALALVASLVWRPVPRREIREFALMPPPGHNFRGLAFERKEFAISPDGSRVAFVAREQSTNETSLWIRELGSSTARRLEGTENPLFPFWSPSGDEVGFFADGRIQAVRADGRAPKTIVELRGQSRGGSWSSDGTILWGVGSLWGGVISRIGANGAPDPVTSLEQGETEQFFPQVLPDGEHFLFFVRSVKPGARGIYVGSLTEASRRFLIRSESNATYATPGYLLFHRDGGLRAQRFDVGTLSLVGEMVSLPFEVEVTRFNHLQASVSADGTMVYASGGLRQQLTWYSREGRWMGALGPAGQHYTFRISPDGSQVAITRFDDEANIWILDVDGAVPVRVTQSLVTDSNGIWSSDASELYFSSSRSGLSALYRARGSQEPELVFPSNSTVHDIVESERAIVTGFATLRAHHLDGAWEPKTIAENTSVSQWISLVSPNGKWIAYWARESGRDEVYVTSFPEPGRRWVVSREGGLRPRWTADGTELFFIGGDGFLYAAPVETERETFESGEPEPLFDLHGAVSYDVALDGRILVNVPLPEPPHLNVVTDWTDALPR